MRETTIFGEVPTRVIVPPSSAPNDIGISSEEGEVFVRRASWKATGISIASAPIFLTKADIRVTAPVSAITCCVGETSSEPSARIGRSMTPERATAALTTSAEATMMTISSPNPLKAFSGGTMPATTAVSSVTMATRS